MILSQYSIFNPTEFTIGMGETVAIILAVSFVLFDKYKKHHINHRELEPDYQYSKPILILLK